MKTDKWFLFSMGLILGFVVMLLGFAMGQQASSDNCQRFGMFHYSGNIYSCQQVRASFDVYIVEKVEK